jgi:DNA-directed RNA polymerase III subunit RPC2
MFTRKNVKEDLNEDELYNKEKLNDEIKSQSNPQKLIKDKWKLLPAFLKVRGLVRQHIDSFNYLINVDLKKIMLANQVITISTDSSFYLKYTNIEVGKPTMEEEMEVMEVTPQECRLRDLTYSAIIKVDIEFTKGTQIIIKKGVAIGRIRIFISNL